MAITVSCNELVGSRKERFTERGCEAVKVYICDWGLRMLLTRELLGWWNGGVYYPPDLYDSGQTYPVVRNVYAYDVNIKPFETPPDTSGQPYRKAHLTVYYKTLDFQGLGDDNVWIEERLEACSEFITLNRDNLFFGTGASAVRLENENIECPTKVNRMLDWVYTVHNVTFLRTTMFELQGSVNASALRSWTLGIQFPAETLLCGNPTAVRNIHTISTPDTWTMTYRFTYKNNGTLGTPYGWNHFPRTDSADADGLKYERITNATDEIPIYPLAEFFDAIHGSY